MSFRIHHLNCGTMCPFGGGLVGGGPLFAPAELVAHCLLVEMPQGLVLVDTGFGEADVARPKERLGSPFLFATRPVLRAKETALEQIVALGFDPRDVRDVVVTHLDLDHAGGLSDFPEAKVHVFAKEHHAAIDRPTAQEKRRYRAPQFAHGPRWQIHEVLGEKWNDFEAVRVLFDDVLLVPLVGHSRGHVAVAVRDGDGWLLHAGDAYFHEHEMRTPPACPPALRLFQSAMSFDDRARRENQERLRALVREKSHVRVFSAHSPTELEALRASREASGSARDGS